MSAWWLLPLALAACLAVVAIAACLSPKPRHAAPRRHLAAVPEPAQDFYGSMSLIEEHPERLPDRDAREQMLADLSPEALDSDVQPDPYLDAIAAGHGSEFEEDDYCQPGCPDDACQALQECAWTQDSGPGDLSSLTPGPDPDDCLLDCDPDCEVGPRHCWWIHQPSHKRGWHSEADCPHTPGPVWLDQQLAVLYEWVRAQYAAAAA